MNTAIDIVDPEIKLLIDKEKYRQFSCLELIASENFTSLAVMQANGSPLTNKYSEGLPGARYYGGNEFIDQIELLTQKRALEAFRLNPDQWAVNVQPYSGSTANFAVFTGLLTPHDRVMGLELPSGGHLTHGYATPKKKISASAIYFESMGYRVNSETGLVDYDELAKNALLFRPKLIICGASAYPRDWDYARFRQIADSVGAYLMADIAHISGLVAAQEASDPFEYCDVVSTTTHKTLRGPRAGLIFCKASLKEQINFAVFPSCQGGPHNNTIAAIATALKHVNTPEFKQYAQQVKLNAVALSDRLVSHGYKLVTGGTDNHLVLWDLRPLGLTGSKMEKICDMVSVTLNKNAVHGDVSALSPGGVRIGTPALTSRDFKEQDFVLVADLLHETCQLALNIQSKCSTKMLKEFVAACENDERVKELKTRVEGFARGFKMPGFDVESIDREAMAIDH